MTTSVSIVKASHYDPELIYRSVKESVDYLGGIEKFVRPGQKVLLKPNLLIAKKPDDAVTTHPAIVAAVIRLVNEAGGKPCIGDSSAMGGWEKVMDRTGIKEVAERYGVETAPFKVSSPVERRESHIFKSLEIAGEVQKADVVINLPKLKSHSLTRMTLGVKNMFGCVVGKRKIQWHLNAASDEICFARMLVEVYEAVSPALTIMDGVIGMEGNGPSGGTPRQMGLILAGTDCIALDTVICSILGKTWDYLLTNRAAKEKRIGETEMNNIRVLGNSINDVAVHGFEFPPAFEMGRVGEFLVRHLQNSFTTKPLEDRKACTLCGICIEMCPPSVITKHSGRLKFDYKKCIRCFCCAEVCPEKAMKVKKGALLRLITRPSSGN